MEKQRSSTGGGGGAGLCPSTFADPRFRNEDSVFVMHECSSGGQEGKLSLKWLIQRAIRPEF